MSNNELKNDFSVLLKMESLERSSQKLLTLDDNEYKYNRRLDKYLKRIILRGRIERVCTKNEYFSDDKTSPRAQNKEYISLAIFILFTLSLMMTELFDPKYEGYGLILPFIIIMGVTLYIGISHNLGHIRKRLNCSNMEIVLKHRESIYNIKKTIKERFPAVDPSKIIIANDSKNDLYEFKYVIGTDKSNRMFDDAIKNSLYYNQLRSKIRNISGLSNTPGRILMEMKERPELQNKTAVAVDRIISMDYERNKQAYNRQIRELEKEHELQRQIDERNKEYDRKQREKEEAYKAIKEIRDELKK